MIQTTICTYSSDNVLKISAIIIYNTLFVGRLKHTGIICVLRRGVRAQFLHLLRGPPGTALGPPIRKNEKTYIILILRVLGKQYFNEEFQSS